MHLSGNEIGQRGRRAAIGNVHQLTPVIILNSSPDTWFDGAPFPPDAIASLPGLALAWAMSSGMVFAGTDGFTSTAFGSWPSAATGAMSRMKLKLSAP